MPTLHLIDADSSQACPAVMSIIHRSIHATPNGDRLLLLGGQPLQNLARQAGIGDTHRIRVPFGKAYLGQRKIKDWLHTQPRFSAAYCWSVDALQAAVAAFSQAPIRLSLVHTPTPSKLKHLRRMIDNRRAGPIRVHVCTDTLRNRLGTAGIRAEVDSTLSVFTEHPPAPPPSTDDLRNDWGACDPSRRVVALLSDHPSQVDAAQAAAIAVLAGASLSDGRGNPQTITLLMHPDQLNRRRAQLFLADQSAGHRVVQDARMHCPWLILHGCDAALALDVDAGGLSLRWALGLGVPVIASANGPAGELTGGEAGLALSPSNAHKDLAHLLHVALSRPAVTAERCGEIY